jgi:nucleotide-binding universal stress UspA family protein
MFKHILVPTDGSEQSLRAARLGIEIAKQFGACVHGFHVLPPLSAINYFSDQIRHVPDDYCGEAEERARQQLEAIHTLARESGVPFDGSYSFDQRPYAAIVCEAKKKQCDLIVMGTHGRTGFDKLVLGGETNKVLNCSDVPVMVCH